MKKFLVIFLAAFISLSSFQNAKSQTFEKGTKVLSLGLGIGYTYSYFNGASPWPTLFGSFEVGAKEIDNIGIISIGGQFGFQHISYSTYDWSWNNIYIAGRGALHLTTIDVDNLDVYGGASLGLRIYTDHEYVYNSGTGNWDWKTVGHVGPAIGFFGGARYYFTPNLAGFGEIGYDVSWLKLGISLKF